MNKILDLLISIVLTIIYKIVKEIINRLWYIPDENTPSFDRLRVDSVSVNYIVL